jgi:FtsZ-binding cell division protein ZapB
MAKKGAQKNTQNKAKHTKLINRKKNKLRNEKEAHKERLKAIVNKAKEQQKEE